MSRWGHCLLRQLLCIDVLRGAGHCHHLLLIFILLLFRLSCSEILSLDFYNIEQQLAGLQYLHIGLPDQKY